MSDTTRATKRCKQCNGTGGYGWCSTCQRHHGCPHCAGVGTVPAGGSDEWIRIEDDDGFVTEWPWPDDRLLLANGDFVAVYEALHDAQRVAGGSDD